MDDDRKDRLDAIFALIKEAAVRKCWPDEDDFCPMEFSGGNFDDAYQGGKEAGEVLFARRLQKLIEGE